MDGRDQHVVLSKEEIYNIYVNSQNVSKYDKNFLKALKFGDNEPINNTETKSRWKSGLWKERDEIGDTFTRRSLLWQ